MKTMKIRIQNLNSLNTQVDIFDDCISLATRLILNDGIFEYTYNKTETGHECIFEIKNILYVDMNCDFFDARNNFLTWMNKECPDIQFIFLAHGNEKVYEQ